MPRKARTKSTTNTYHICIKALNSQLMFEESKDFKKYLDILAYQKENCGFELFAYCLMSNHVHLLIRVNQIPLESIFRKINTTYASWFNLKYKRTGSFQDGRYYSEPVEDISYLLASVRYIHCNPLKAKLENAPGESYPWNSYALYLSDVETIVDTSLVLSELGGIQQYIDFHNQYSSESVECFDIEKIRKRLPDDVAKEIIRKECQVNSTLDLQNVDLISRRKYIFLLKEKGISTRQLNRLTGIPRGVIERILTNKL